MTAGAGAQPGMNQFGVGQQQEKKVDPAATSLNKAAAEFVPKGKMVKTEEQFPDLGAALTKEAPKQKK